MDQLFFIPAWPLQVSELVWLGLALLCAVLLSEFMQRVLRLPRITGYVLTGILAGPVAQHFGSPDLTNNLRPIFEFAFGLLVFELGQRIDLGWLRRNPWLLATSLAESLLAFAFIDALLLFLGVTPLVALLTAGITASTGPAVVLGVCQDNGARGPVTDRLHLLCALNSCYGFLALGVAYAWQHHTKAASLALSLLHPLYLIVGSALFGALIAYTVLAVLARIRAGQNSQTLAAIAILLTATSLTETLNLSVMVALLAAGVLCRTMDQKRRLQPMDFGLVGRLALICVFASTGALLNLSALTSALAPAIGLLAARALGKATGVFIFSRPAGLAMRKASLLSISLLPMSGAVLLWVDRTNAIWPDLGAQIAAIALPALVIMELLAPPALQFALGRARETKEEDA